jgi:hypothetical protein
MADKTQITSGPQTPAPAKTTTRKRSWIGRLLGGLALAVLMGGSTLVWMERDPLRAWLYVRNLSAASDDSARQRWAGYVGDLGEPAVPGLCVCLHQDDPQVCHNAQAGLAALAERWGRSDRTATLLQTLALDYDRFSTAGQQQTLELVARWFAADGPPPEASLVQAGASLLARTMQVTDPDVHAAALDLAEVLATRGPEPLAAARDLVCVSLRASTPSLRARAVQLSLLRDRDQVPVMDLQVQVANLLTDPDVDVRGKALLAVGGPDNTKVLTETLLPCLRDPDPKIQSLCRMALGSRGLSEAHIELAFVLTDPDPRKRVEVLNMVQNPDISDLVDPVDWFRRLSHDPDGYVRATAAIYMAKYVKKGGLLNESRTGLTDRLAQMAQSDPMESVREIAEYHLRSALK